MVRSTKAFVPWIKVFQKRVGNREDARKVEKHYKSAAGRRYIWSIIKSGINSF